MDDYEGFAKLRIREICIGVRTRVSLSLSRAQFYDRFSRPTQFQSWYIREDSRVVYSVARIFRHRGKPLWHLITLCHGRDNRHRPDLARYLMRIVTLYLAIAKGNTVGQQEEEKIKASDVSELEFLSYLSKLHFENLSVHLLNNFILLMLSRFLYLFIIIICFFVRENVNAF